jgi:hypothetical protein
VVLSVANTAGTAKAPAASLVISLRRLFSTAAKGDSPSPSSALALCLSLSVTRFLPFLQSFSVFDFRASPTGYAWRYESAAAVLVRDASTSGAEKVKDASFATSRLRSSGNVPDTPSFDSTGISAPQSSTCFTSNASPSVQKIIGLPLCQAAAPFNSADFSAT